MIYSRLKQLNKTNNFMFFGSKITFLNSYSTLALIIITYIYSKQSWIDPYSQNSLLPMLWQNGFAGLLEAKFRNLFFRHPIETLGNMVVRFRLNFWHTFTNLNPGAWKIADNCRDSRKLLCWNNNSKAPRFWHFFHILGIVLHSNKNS